MPKTDAALPNNQYATILLLTSGYLDLIAEELLLAAFAAEAEAEAEAEAKDADFKIEELCFRTADAKGVNRGPGAVRKGSMPIHLREDLVN